LSGLAIIQDEDDDEAVFLNQNDVLEEYNIDEEGILLVLALLHKLH
jgi:hypothetical protein